MSNRFYNFSHQSSDQLRRLGARGGRAARNQRARRALTGASAPSVPVPPISRITTAEDIAVLDARFPWLRGAEKRSS